ncbi:MAG TPA: hypothetical protein ENO23_00105 [Alphaproteobacteria bacterium]|nr:hypothetical protein [Alphaproteobacteria bacterium]
MSRPRIRLSLDADQAQSLFRRVVDSAHSPAQSLAGLNALELLLGCHTEAGDRQRDVYREVRAALTALLERERERLLAQQAGCLCEALTAQDAAGVARVHGALSREAFYQAARGCAATLPQDALRAAARWARDWRADAEHRAAAASPYPDALDWKAAGIDVQEYLSMGDLVGALAEVLA